MYRGLHRLSRFGQTLEHALAIRQRVGDHSDVGHSTLGRFTARSLLPYAGRVDLDVAHSASAGVTEPVPRFFATEGAPLLHVFGDPLPGRFRGALDGRFAQPNAGRFLEQFGALLEAVGDRSAERGESLDGW